MAVQIGDTQKAEMSVNWAQDMSSHMQFDIDLLSHDLAAPVALTWRNQRDICLWGPEGVTPFHTFVDGNTFQGLVERSFLEAKGEIKKLSQPIVILLRYVCSYMPCYPAPTRS